MILTLCCRSTKSIALDGPSYQSASNHRSFLPIRLHNFRNRPVYTERREKAMLRWRETQCRASGFVSPV